MRLRLGLAQINPIVGDLKGNAEKIVASIKEVEGKVDLLIFPELAITGYPPEDLLLKSQFLTENLKMLNYIAEKTGDVCVVVGFVDVQEDIYNAAAVIYKGKVRGVYHKIFLPNYGVFDEARYFQKGRQTPVFLIRGIRVGVNICEDIWFADGPHLAQSLGGDAQIIVNISSSPYSVGKPALRERILSTRAHENSVILAYTNLVGGQDELVFDGGSMVFNEKGELIARARQFEEDLLILDVDIESVFRTRLQDPRRRSKRDGSPFTVPVIKVEEENRSRDEWIKGRIEKPLPHFEEILKALILGTRDYVRKNGFKKVLVGLSGGIDSSLVCSIAVEALGKDKVIGVIMPSPYTSPSSIRDAQELANNLGIKTFTISIERIFNAYREELKKEVFHNLPEDVTEENIQARIRGNLLMALSNKFGYLVLTTGNKSEMSCGYATLYGDMAGGFAVIKDIYKTWVYKLARLINHKRGNIIPENVFRKAPSAELRPGQTDQDTLPPYEKLDPVLEAYVEKELSFPEILEMGHDEEMIKKVIYMVDKNEYKRRQAPPGIKITPRAFGKDRRLPITNHFLPFS